MQFSRRLTRKVFYSTKDIMIKCNRINFTIFQQMMGITVLRFHLLMFKLLSQSN